MIVRPSGTEPKIKCYLEVVVPVNRTVSTTISPPSTHRRAADLTRSTAADDGPRREAEQHGQPMRRSGSATCSSDIRVIPASVRAPAAGPLLDEDR